MEQKQMSFSQTILTLLISGALPIYFEHIRKIKIIEGSSTLFVILWFVLNFMFVITITQMIKDLSRLKRLKNLKYNLAPMTVGTLAIVLFAISINAYFITQVYVKSPESFRIFLPAVFVLLLGVYILTLFYGRLPEINRRDNLTIFNVRKDKAPIRDGFEKFGTHTGSYDEGIVVGHSAFTYDSIRSTFVDKSGTLVIKGKNDYGSYVINYGAEKGKENLIGILKNKGILK